MKQSFIAHVAPSSRSTSTRGLYSISQLKAPASPRAGAGHVSEEKRPMRQADDEHRIDEAKPAGHSRRGFIVSAATASAGAGAASLLNAQPAPGANAKMSDANAQGPYPTEGMAAYAPTGPLKRMTFQRRALGPKDVAIKIHYCGVCHSDIHTIHGDWGPVQYPADRGHEIAGKVVAVGSSVSKFAVGARVGVGTMVNSCRRCSECQAGSRELLPQRQHTDVRVEGPGRHDHARRIFDVHRRRRRLRHRHPRRHRSRRRRAAAVRGHHRLLAAPPMGRVRRASRWRSSAWVVSAISRSSSRRRWARR